MGPAILKWLLFVSGILVGAFISTYIFEGGYLERRLVGKPLIIHDQKWENKTSGHVVNSNPSPVKGSRLQNTIPEVPLNRETKTKAPSVDEFFNDVTVVCMILTCVASKQSAMRVKYSWPTRCNNVIFISDAEDTELPAMKFGGLCSDRTGRISRSFDYANEHHLDNADWIFVAYDVTFVIMENLRLALSVHEPTDPLLFGHTESDGCWNLNGGFVMSRQAVSLFVERSTDPDDPCTGTGHTTTSICACMKKLNVTISDLKDEDGKSRFHCNGVLKQLQGRDERLKPLVNKTGSSKDSGVSRFPISFYDTSVLQLEFFHYNFGVYGRHRPERFKETMHDTTKLLQTCYIKDLSNTFANAATKLQNKPIPNNDRLNFVNIFESATAPRGCVFVMIDFNAIPAAVTSVVP